jgi:hypothetical protein
MLLNPCMRPISAAQEDGLFDRFAEHFERIWKQASERIEPELDDDLTPELAPKPDAAPTPEQAHEHGASHRSVTMPTGARFAQASDLPRWAVIKNARRRQRRRRMRVVVAIGAALFAAGAWALRSGRGPTARFPAPAPPSARQPVSIGLGGTPIDAVATPRSVWVLVCTRRCSGTEVSSGALLHVSSRSDRVISRFPVADPQALTLGAGAIWIAHFAAGTVTRVDPRTGRTSATIHLALPQPVAAGDRRFLPSGISFGAGMVWVSTARGQLAVISARTSRQVAMVPSPSEETHTTIAGHRTWVAEDLAGIGIIAHEAHRLTIHRISQAGQPVDVVDVKSGGGRIWTFGPS